MHKPFGTGDPETELAITERLTFMPEGFLLTVTPRVPAAVSDPGDRASTGAG